MDQQPAETQRGRKSSPKHGPNGDFVATPETAARDAEAARLRGQGMGYQAIADQLGISLSTAHEAVQRALRAIRAEGAAEARQLELERLDRLYEAAVRVLERDHITVSQGRIIRTRVLDDDGEPIIDGYEDSGKPIYRERDLLDDGPTLKAVETLLKIQQRRAALLGLDAPVKADVGGKLSYEIIGVDPEQL